MAGEIGSAFVRIRPNMSGFRGGVQTGVAASFGGIGRIAAIAGAGLGVGLFKSVITQAADFQSALLNLQAVSGATSTQMTAISQRAKALGNDLTLPATSAKDAADAMTELVKGGVSVTDTMKAAKGVLQLSAAAQISNADAATITARALGTFSLSGDKAVHVADVLANAANKSTGEITDYAAAFQQAGLVASQTGLTIDETAAALMQFAQAGLVGSDAGTSFKTMLLRLTPSTKKAKEEFDSLGVSAFDGQGKFVGYRNVIGQLHNAFEKLTPKQQAQAKMTIFGTDAIRAATVAINDGVAGFDHMRTAAGESGAAAALAAAKMKGFHGALEGFKSTLQTVAIDIGEKLLPVSTQVLKVFSKMTQAFDKAFAVGSGGASGVANALQNIPSDAGMARVPVDIDTTSFGQRFQAGITAAIATVDWASVGKSILAGITAGIQAAGDLGVKVAGLIRDTMRAIDWNEVGRSAGPGFAAMLTSAVSTLLDPMFWVQNWDLLIAIALAAFPAAKLAAPLKLIFSKIGYEATAGLAAAIGESFPRLGDALISAFARLGPLASAAVKPLEDLVRAAFNRLGGISQFVVKVLGIDAAINAIADFSRAVGEKIGGAARAIPGLFRAGFTGFARIGLEAAADVVEPFTHLPGFLGGWARNAKTSIQRELAQIDLRDFQAKFDREFDAQIPKMAPIGRNTGQAWAKGFAGAPIVPIVQGKVKESVSNEGNTAAGAAGGRSVGSSFGTGVAAGIAASSGAVNAAAAAVVAQAVATAQATARAQSPSLETAEKVGYPFAQGISVGIQRGAPEVARAASSSVQKMIGAAVQEIKDSRGKLDEAFDSLKSAADAAFTALGNRITPSGKKLAAMQLEDQRAQVKESIDAARKDLETALKEQQTLMATLDEESAKVSQKLIQAQLEFARAEAQAAAAKTAAQQAAAEKAVQAAQFGVEQAQAGVSGLPADQQQQVQDAAQAVADAQKRLADANRAQTEFELGLQAEKESKKQIAFQNQQQTGFNAALAALKKALAEQGATHDEAQQAVLRLLKKYHIQYRGSGVQIGAELAAGLRSAKGEVAAAAEELADEIRKHLKLKSPAEKGPLSDLDRWFTPFVPTLLSALNPGDLSNDLAARLGLRNPGGAAPSPGSTLGSPATLAALHTTNLEMLEELRRQTRALEKPAAPAAVVVGGVDPNLVALAATR